jgi:dipeptidase
MLKNIFMKKSLFFSIILFSQFFLHSQQSHEHNCYTIIVGKDASFDGSVLVGHNEDDHGDMLVNWYKVPGKKFKDTDSIQLLNGTKIPQNFKTNSYIRFQVTDQKFGDAFVNRHSLVVCSNKCISKEDSAKGNISHYFRRLVAERARSAYHAVQIGSQLIESLGYNANGRTYTFADNKEVWMFSAIGGKHWIAKRIPDNHIAIIPNYFTITEVDLKDSLNVLHSPGLVEYAVNRGWYDSQSNTEFNFREVFGNPKVNKADYNIPRHLVGLNYFSEKVYTEDDSFPFSFEPKQKVSVKDIKNVLSNHFENTEYYKPHESLNLHKNLVHTICGPTTQLSFIAQLRSDMPYHMGTLVWIAPYNPCIYPYVPIYFGANEIDKQLCLHDSTTTNQLHFDKEHNQIKYYKNMPTMYLIHM